MNRITPHHFPAWLRANIPLLETAETNPVYQAFLTRRRGWSLFDLRSFLKTIARNRSPGGCLTLLVVASLITLPIALQSPFGSTRQTAIFSVIAIGAILVAAMWVSNRNQHVIPRKALEAFRSESTDKDVAFDLWQAGVTGADILDALVMESTRSTLIAHAIFHLIAAGVFCVVLISPAPMWSLVGYVILNLLIAALTFVVGCPHAVHKTHRTTANVLIARWRRTDELMVRIKRSARIVLVQVAIAISILVAVIIVLPFLVIVIMEISDLLSPHVPVWIRLQVLGVIFHTLILVGGYAIAAYCRDRDLARVNGIRADASEAFEIFIRAEVIADPDARRTAGEVTMAVEPGEALHG